MEQANETIEQENTASIQPAPANTRAVITIPRTTFNYILVAVVFFLVGIAVTLMTTNNPATIDYTEMQELIGQAVSDAFDERGESIAQAGKIDPNARVEVSVDDDPAFGPDNASVVMIEFSDFNCPYCGRFSQDTLPLIRENYEDQIHFVYRDFPILSESSQEAAIASECANDQGAFWEFHDLLFENQGDFNQNLFISFVEQLELNIEQFTSCQNDSTTRDEVLDDYATAQSLGANGTPTFFINGRRVVGAQPYEVFQKMIDEELVAGTEAQSSDTP